MEHGDYERGQFDGRTGEGELDPDIRQRPKVNCWKTKSELLEDSELDPDIRQRPKVNCWKCLGLS